VGAVLISLQRSIFVSFLMSFASLLWANESLGLNADERAWLTHHPIIRVGVDQNWPPFDYVDSKGRHQGISSSYLKLLTKKLGVQFKISSDVWSRVLQGTKTHQLDMLACASNTVERREYLNFTQPYIEIDNVFVTRESTPAVNTLADLSGKTVALPKGTYINELLKSKGQNISFYFVPSNEEALQAVSLGKADAYVGNLAVVSYFIEKDLLTNLHIDNRLSFEKSKLAFAVRKDWPILQGILAKGLASISDDERKIIIRKWVNFSEAEQFGTEITLTEVENQWLQSHKVIKIGVDPAWPPIEYIDVATKKYQGIASDYVAYLENTLAIKMPYNPDLSWKQVINKVKIHEIDVLPAISRTAEREKYLNFTRPYLKSPYVIFTRSDSAIITGIDELLDKKIVVEKNYANYEILRTHYPQVELVLVDTTQQALAALSEGLADAYMGNLAATSQILLSQGLTNIKVAAPTPFSNDLSFAVRKDWPVLLDIIQKVLDSITVEQQNTFKKKWFAIRYEYSTDYTLIWQIGAVTLLILLIFGLWLLQIRHQREALRLSDERFQLAMQASQEGLWDWNIKTGAVYFNPSYAEMLGYQQDELTAEYATWELLLHPEDKESAIQTLKNAIAQCLQQYKHEFRLQHKDGHYIDVLSIGSVVSQDQQGHALRLVGTAQNITERKQIKTALEQQKFALDASSIVAITDMRGNITYVNDKLCQISGYSQQELIGQNHRLLNSGVHPKKLWSEMFKQAAKGIPWRHEICNKAKDGALYWVDTTVIGLFSARGKLEQYIAIRTDISERKKAEQELKEREQQFSSLIHNIPGTFYQYTKKGTWAVKFITSEIEQLTGFSVADFMAKGGCFEQLTHPDDQRQVMVQVEQAVAEHKVYAMEYRIIHRDLSLRWVQEKGVPIFDEQGELLYLQGAMFDITENKQVELELLEAKQIAEQASHSKSDFLSNMSHEIRTPMNAIIGLGYLVLKTDLNSQQQDYIHKIQNAGQSLLTIINDILDFSKIEAGKLHLESVNFQLDPLFDNLADLFRFSSEEKGIELIFDINANVPNQLIGDPTRLAQVLTNFCSNALKFTEQGEIKISVERVKLTAKKVILRFAVRDTGSGIPKNQQSQLFDSFSQADSSTTRLHGGTGLGLAICKKLVALMQGDIGLESEVGVGSEFYFFAEFGCEVQMKKKGYSLQSDMRGLRVLVVDDNATARQVLRDQLASLSFKVTTVKSAMEAYAVLQKSSKVFDLILMDWSMPEINGLDAVKYIKKQIHLSAIPAIIMVTAYAQDQVAQEAHVIGLDGFIVKPVTASTLFDAIMNALQPTTVSSIQAELPLDNLKLEGCVLLVEDNIINQQVAEELLKSFGLTVVIANNGIEAVDNVIQQAGQFDVVLMDIQMPEMDGIQATKEIRKLSEYKDLPIIAMTAHAMMGDKEKSLQAGMNEHITKPIEPDELYRTLMHWLKPVTDSVSNINKPEQKPEPFIALPDYSENIDIDWGLKRVGGNRKLFAKLLCEFYQDHRLDIELLAKALLTEEKGEAQRIIHTIKGVTGNIGAQKVHEICIALEQDILNSEDYALNLTAFKKGFSELMDELSGFNQQGEVKEPQGAVLKNTQLAQEMQRLYGLLQDGEVGTLDSLQKIAPNLNQQGKALVEGLHRAIEDYDYDLALTQLKVICDDLKIDIT